jgi:hypothetical protein
VREFLGEALKRPMLENAHRSRLFPQDLGDIAHVQAGKYTKENHLSLAARKLGDPRQRSFGVFGGEDGALGIFRSGSRRDSVEATTRGGRVTPATAVIDEPAAGDREEPTPKRPFVTLETA